MKVKSILIVGGGSSGWMTAAALIRQVPNIKISLIESDVIPKIGVGESTIGHINSYMHAVGLNDADWMPECNATYKTSIRFTDFREKNEKPNTFHYPFGTLDFSDKPRGPMEWFHQRALNPDALPEETFAEFYHDHVIMANQNKFTENLDNEIRNFNFLLDTAYHMDAGLFGKYLRDVVCVPEGVTHIVDDVVDFTKNEDGSLSGIITKNSGTLTADLYVDCTGFKSLLIEGAMGSEFTSFHDTLLNDSAIATVIPYIDREGEMTSVTNCTALDAGWVWNIPLWNRIGTGYVYSSKYATPEEAEAQFRKHLASDRMDYYGEGSEKRAQEAELRHIKIKHGSHKKPWIKNVVAVGLASGFIEPLESTGLMLTHESIMKLLTVLQNRDGLVIQYDIDSFNHAVYDQTKGFKDFISLHYALSKRNDTPYWKHITEELHFNPQMVNWDAQLRNTYMDLAQRNLMNHSYDPGMGGLIYIAAGHGYSPTNKRIISEQNLRNPQTLQQRMEELQNESSLVLWEKHKKQLQETIDRLPTHYQWLKDNYYKDKEE